MPSVLASHIPKSVSQAEIHDIFSFCGKIAKIVPVPAKENTDTESEPETDDLFQQVQVCYESNTALKAAFLLDQSELGGVPITVKVLSRDHPPKTVTFAPTPPKEFGDHKIQYEDWSREVTKPVSSAVIVSTAKEPGTRKEGVDFARDAIVTYTIITQLLSCGYVLSEKLFEHAIKTDSEKGYSAKVMTFLDEVDRKYVHLQEPESTTNKTLGHAAAMLSDWASAFNETKYRKHLDKYCEQAAEHSYSKRALEIFNVLSRGAGVVHKESVRLAIKKKKELALFEEKKKRYAAAAAAATTSPNSSQLISDANVAANASPSPASDSPVQPN